MDRGAWRTVLHDVTKSQKQLRLMLRCHPPKSLCLLLVDLRQESSMSISQLGAILTVVHLPGSLWQVRAVGNN